jgi:TP901 family phage tail tape measure protein
MTNRTVQVTLVANIADYKRNLQQAAAETRGLAKEVSTATGKGAEGYQKIGLAASAAGVVVAAGIGKMISASMGFEKSMSGLRAATGASAASMEALRESALKVGEDTSFSATQAVEAQTALAKAGVSTADILGGALAGAASLAAAGQLEMGDAAEIAATAMTQFELAGQDVPHIADLLAAGAGKAQGEVRDLAAALNQSGLVAAQTGLTIEETTGGLAAFASAGLLGSDAGTSFKTMLQRLNPQSDEAAALMDDLGLRAYDAQGQFVGLSEYAGQLQSALGGMSAEQRNAAMSTLFGSDAVRAAAVLYEQGAEGVEQWEKNVADAGFASRTAATMTDNLAGDLERLGGSIETALIENGTAANGVLREMVQLADGAVGVFSDMPGPVQGVATGVTALAGAAGLASGAFLLAAPKITEFKASLEDMGPRSQKFGKGILGAGNLLAGPWGLALAGGVVALGLFSKAKADAKAQVDAFTSAIQADSGAIGENARQVAAAALEKRGLLKAAEDLGMSLELVTRAATGDDTALAALRRSVDGYSVAATDAARAAFEHGYGLDEEAAAAGDTAGKAETLLGKVEDLAGATEEGQAAARRNAEALGEQEAATGGAAAKTDVLTDSTKEAVAALDAQANALRAQYDPIFAMQQAVLAHAEAQAAVKTAVKEHGSASKEAAKAEWEMLEATVGLSGASNALTSAVQAGTTSVDSARGQLKRWVEQGLITQGQADTLAGKIGGLTERADKLTDTPATLKVNEVGLTSTSAEMSLLERKLRQIDGLTATVDVVTRYRSIGMPGVSTPRLTGAGGGVQKYSDGGPVYGPGGPTSDTIPALLSPGEPVRHASAMRSLPAPRLKQLVGAGR